MEHIKNICAVLLVWTVSSSMAIPLGLPTSSSDHYIPVYSASSSFPSYRPHHGPPVYKPQPHPVYRPQPSYKSNHIVTHSSPKIVTYKPQPKTYNEPIHKAIKVVHEPVYKPSVQHHKSKPVHHSHHEPQYHHIDHHEPHSSHHHQHHKDQVKPYAFDYGVNDQYHGTNFGHSEKSDGKEVKGSYTVALPDGRIQKVTYVADHYNGFQAKVTYEGEAKFPAYQPKKSYHHEPKSYHHEPKSYHHEPKSYHHEPHHEPKSYHHEPHHEPKSYHHEPHHEPKSYQPEPKTYNHHTEPVHHKTFSHPRNSISPSYKSTSHYY